MLQEISRKSIHISKNEELLLSWHNSVLTVRTDKGIQLFDFSYNLQCLDKNIDFVVSFITNPKSSPASEMFPNRYIQLGLNNMDLTQMIVDPGFWPYNPQLTHEMANIVTFEWSTAGIIYNNENILAILNNIGNVEFLGPSRFKWEVVLDLSSLIKKHYEESQSLKVSNCFEEVKKDIDSVETSSVRWGPKVSDNSCYFVTGQRNGNIFFWLIQCQEMGVQAEFLGEIQTDIGEILTVLWVPKSDKNFLLISANVMGQIFAFDCEMIKNVIKLIKSTCLWSHKDRMIPKYLLHTVVEDKIILFYNKHRHLVVQMIDQNCNIMSQIVNNVNDYRITDITGSDDRFYISTVNCKIYKIDLVFLNENLNANLTLVEIKDQYTTYELYNFGFSYNKVIWALAMVDRKVRNRKHPEKIDIIFLCTDLKYQSEVSLLLSNPTKKLTNFWDCIELLRFKAMKLKALPSIDYTQLYIEGNTDLYKIKLYLIFVVLYNTLEKIIKNNSKGVLPETSVEIVREKILVASASKLISDLHDTGKSNGQLSNFEVESYIATKKYLEYFCRKYNRHLNEFVASNVLNFIKTDHQYLCQCCDETIEGLTCQYGHINMFCSVSFTTIDNLDYLVCKSCNSTARIELYRNRPTCPYCDLYLNNCYLPS